MNTSRRSFLTALGTLAAAPLLARDFAKNAPPIRYPDPDVIALEDAFKKIKIGNAAIERLLFPLVFKERAVAGIGEPDAAVGMDHDVVRRIERLAGEFVSEHGDRAV